MGGEVNRHANWKTIEPESREFVTIVNYVHEGFYIANWLTEAYTGLSMSLSAANRWDRVSKRPSSSITKGDLYDD